VYDSLNDTEADDVKLSVCEADLDAVTSSVGDLVSTMLRVAVTRAVSDIESETDWLFDMVVSRVKDCVVDLLIVSDDDGDCVPVSDTDFETVSSSVKEAVADLLAVSSGVNELVAVSFDALSTTVLESDTDSEPVSSAVKLASLIDGVDVSERVSSSVAVADLDARVLLSDGL
jgi:hypothetical protein